MLQTEKDAQCDKLAVDSRKYRQLVRPTTIHFVTLSVHLCRADSLRRSTCRGEVVLEVAKQIPVRMSEIIATARDVVRLSSIYRCLSRQLPPLSTTVTRHEAKQSDKKTHMFHTTVIFVSTKQSTDNAHHISSSIAPSIGKTGRILLYSTVRHKNSF